MILDMLLGAILVSAGYIGFKLKDKIDSIKNIIISQDNLSKQEIEELKRILDEAYKQYKV